jgi:hypothetical protein
MFFKGSRYKDLPKIRSTDAKGQTARSKTLRWIPDTPGTFLHTLNQTDRLDLLAYKYYGNPKKWWLICDANPDFALPINLLDRTPIVQEIVNLEPPEGDNKWPILIRALQELRGMREVQADIFQATLNVTYNRKELDRAGITNVITAQGFTVKTISKKERIGQKITIPPNQIV